MKRILFLISVVVLLSGCLSRTEKGVLKPLSLKVAVNDIYCADSACSCILDVAARTYPETLAQLAGEYGVELQFDYFMDSYQLEDAIRSGQYEAVLCKPWYAMRLNRQVETDYQRLVDVLDPGNGGVLTGIVIVPVDSSIQSLEELNGRHVFLGEADCYEKHQAALRLFKQQGIKPAKIGTNSSCVENIGVLQDGKADAAVISDYALSADCAVDFANPEDFRILAHTEEIPLTSLLIDKNKVDDQQAFRIKQALLSVSGADAAPSLFGQGFVDPRPWAPPELEERP